MQYLLKVHRGLPGQQRDALRRLRQELAALPVHNPVDGFSNRQHDQLLYGDV